VLRENTWFNRGWHDTVIFSMLESEWEKLRGRIGNQEAIETWNAVSEKK
jgi:hypothetical protein